MFDHVKFGVSYYAASKAFFLRALEPLGVTVVSKWPPNSVELSQPQGKVSMCLYQTEETPAGCRRSAAGARLARTLGLPDEAHRIGRNDSPAPFALVAARDNRALFGTLVSGCGGAACWPLRHDSRRRRSLCTQARRIRQRHPCERSGFRRVRDKRVSCRDPN